MTTTEAQAITRVHRLASTDRLRSLREASGLAQADIARELGVARSSVSRWERNTMRIRGRHAVKLLVLLDGES